MYNLHFSHALVSGYLSLKCSIMAEGKWLRFQGYWRSVPSFGKRCHWYESDE